MEQKYWFRAKRYGWGWGLPLTWQGWLTILIYLIVVVGNVITISPNVSTFQEVLPQIVPSIVATVLLLTICFLKGEKLRGHLPK